MRLSKTRPAGIYRLLTQIIVTCSCFFIISYGLEEDMDDVGEGQPCDPDLFEARLDMEDETNFWTCDGETR